VHLARPSCAMQSRHRAIQALRAARAFSTSSPRPAVSPYRRAAQTATTKVIRDNAQRPQSTAAATATETETRARPAPAFNREDGKEPQPLKPYRSPEMDHSFVGMKGGQIFHEMMLRQNVKHICTQSREQLA
jgi:acetolactate synthase-1/2/3 large subunit